MAILGIDYGAKKIGLAKSDEANKFALPLEILTGKSQPEILARLNEVCQEHQIEKIIVGVPVSMRAKGNGELFREVDLQNKQMQEVLNFVAWLKENIDLPVETEDERLSTKMANGLRRDLVKKGPDDAVAAMLILQSYLDKLNH
ncbi:MAG: Holliday junction resolvase RuvX [Patescibacteria group bacterium]|jgi:putative Holliday junction resolvase